MTCVHGRATDDSCPHCCGFAGFASGPARPTPEVAPDVLLDTALILILERPNMPKRPTSLRIRWEERIAELLALPEYRAWRARRSPGSK